MVRRALHILPRGAVLHRAVLYRQDLEELLYGTNLMQPTLRRVNFSSSILSCAPSLGAGLLSANFSSCGNLTSVEPLQECTSLTHLDLSFCAKLATVDCLVRCSKLRCLLLDSSGFAGDCWSLAGFAQLEVLDLSRLETVVDLSVLARMKRLKVWDPLKVTVATLGADEAARCSVSMVQPTSNPWIR